MEGRPAWDIPTGGGDSGAEDSDIENVDDIGVGDAQQLFCDLLLDLKVRGKLSAKDVCVLSWYASKGGLGGGCQELAYRPDAPSGHFQRRLDAVTWMSSKVDDAYIINLPSFDKYHASRCELRVPFLPLHESMQRELEEDPTIEDRLQKSLCENEWAKDYHEHPLVENKTPGEVVYPMAIYLDGVPFLKRDGLLGVYGYNLVTNVRHLICVVRKSQVCQCSCHGWCTWYHVMSFVRWNIEVLAEGRMPRCRHDNTDFVGPEDEWRAGQAGRRIIKAAAVNAKGDWSEFSHTLGLPTWQSVLNPCFCCHGTRDDMREICNFSALSSPWPEKTTIEYERACLECEIWRTIPDVRTHQMIWGALMYDRSKDGYKGRRLDRDLPELNLLRGDRLEPCPFLTNVGNYAQLRLPARVMFWRVKNQTIATRRNPIFSPTTHLSITHLAIDPLHTLHLGVYKAFVARALWCLVQNDVWKVGVPTQEERYILCIQRLRSELFAWYKERKRLSPQDPLYELQELKQSMMGTPEQPELATKAAETGTLIEFCAYALQVHQAAIRREEIAPLIQVGRALVAGRELMRTRPRVLNADDCQTLVDTAKVAFTRREAAGIPWTPKWHMFLHMCHQARTKGEAT